MRRLRSFCARPKRELRLQKSVAKPELPGATFYNWRKKYGGLMPSEIKRLKQLDEENARLKGLVADLSLDKAMLQDVLKRKL